MAMKEVVQLFIGCFCPTPKKPPCIYNVVKCTQPC